MKTAGPALADTKLRGLHNIENLMATLAVGVARGLSFEQMVPAIRDYEPRPHRCEFVRELGGVEYVNDSKATNLDAVEKALAAQTKPVVLIAGGKDKGFTFDPLRSLVKDKVKSAVLIGEMAESIRRSWDGAVKSEIATSLADAVERARSLASPATLSCSLRAHHRSTCSKATPIAAINFANWCKRSRNETD
jgi:UDP-N-acetylmuramoylalanine--D-glutamate ligase